MILHQGQKLYKYSIKLIKSVKYTYINSYNVASFCNQCNDKYAEKITNYANNYNAIFGNRTTCNVNQTTF